eukprot:g12387.t1
MSGMMNNAVVLLSGGLDSATTLAIAREQGFACHAISFDYGQKQRVELQAAANLAKDMQIASHRTVRVDLGAFGGSALTDDTLEVPKDRSDDDISHGIPITYVPARNTVFLSYALGLAEVVGAHDIFIGVNAVDYSGYPDCRPEFVAAFQNLANLATKAGVEGQTITVHAPLIELTKVQIIEQGLALGVDYAKTHSCYDPTPEGKPCGRCDACLIRIAAFESLGMTDPALSF